jgi:hypothetical protein
LGTQLSAAANHVPKSEDLDSSPVGVTQEGWYWLEEPRSRQTKSVDKELLLKLITLVNDYEFESP